MKTRRNTFRAKLWRYFALFAVAVLALLWLLQTVFLQAFYDASVKVGTRDAATRIEQAWTQEDPIAFASSLDELASEKSLLIFVADWDHAVLYSTDEHSAEYAGSDGHQQDHGQQESWRSAESDETPSWLAGQSRNLGLTQGFDAFLERLAANPSSAIEYQDEDSALYTYGIALPSKGREGSACATAGREAVLYLSTTLQPVGAAASAIRTQLVFATVVALALAFALAFALARGFSKPVEALNRKAASLAPRDGGETRQTSGAPAFEEGFCAELDELSATLDDASAQLADVEAQRAEFMANVSHDLRTPLTLIKGYAEAALDDMRDGLGPSVADLEVVAREADRLSSLSGELLDYAKLRDAGVPMQFAPFDASGTVEQAAALFSPLCEKAGIALDVQAESGVCAVGDEDQIARVLTNLIDNAASHTSSSGTVAVSLRKSDGFARFEVADDGPGIPAEELDLVWERYFTKRQSARNAKGSGLGLAISKKILDAHGARSGVESEPGRGTTFWFELPTS